MSILEIEAEGLPRYVGPFKFRHEADDWAKQHVRNGSWIVISPVHPHQVEVEEAKEREHHAEWCNVEHPAGRTPCRTVRKLSDSPQA